MSPSQSSPTPVQNGNVASPSVHGMKGDQAGAFHQLVNAMKLCLKYESYYINAEAVKAELVEKEAKLETMSKQMKQNEIAYNKLLQTYRNFANQEEANKKSLSAKSEEHRKELSDLSAKLAQYKKEIGSLNKVVEKKEKMISDNAQTLSKSEACGAELKKSLETTSKDLTATKQQLDRHRGELDKWKLYRARLVAVDMHALQTSIQALWEGIQSYAEEYFYTQVSQNVLERQERWLQTAQSCMLGTKIPSFPASNSVCAMSMRKTVALAVLASLFEKHMLLATYVEGADELHELLEEKAKEDDEAESLCRAQILSLLDVDEQSEKVEEARTSVKDQFLSFATQILEPERYREFNTHLDELLKTATDIWQVAQTSSHKIVAGNWVGPPALWDDFRAAMETSGCQTSASTEDDQHAGTGVALVVFPGFVTMKPGRVSSLSPRVVVTEGQVARARAIWEKEQSQIVSTTTRRPTRRRKDSGVETNIALKDQPFLGGS